jgi:sporulation protein YlmC with PRC-barrel domain
MICAGDLNDLPVTDEAGRSLGHVFEIRAEHGRVTALLCGPGAFWARLLGRRRGRRVPWDDVVSVEAHRIVIRGRATDRG